MNERIKELAKQASDVVAGNAFSMARYNEKFAELIIRECADIAKHHVMNISTYADADFVEKQIKENFGVTE